MRVRCERCDSGREVEPLSEVVLMTSSLGRLVVCREEAGDVSCATEV